MVVLLANWMQILTETKMTAFPETTTAFGLP